MSEAAMSTTETETTSQTEQSTTKTSAKAITTKETTRLRAPTGEYEGENGRQSAGRPTSSTERPPVGKFQLTSKEVEQVKAIWNVKNRSYEQCLKKTATFVAQALGHDSPAQRTTMEELRASTSPDRILSRGCDQRGVSALFDGVPPPLNGDGGMLLGPGVYFSRDEDKASRYASGAMISAAIDPNAKVFTSLHDNTKELTKEVVSGVSVNNQGQSDDDSDHRNWPSDTKFSKFVREKVRTYRLESIGLCAMLCGYQACDFTETRKLRVGTVTIFDKSILHAASMSTSTSKKSYA